VRPPWSGLGWGGRFVVKERGSKLAAEQKTDVGGVGVGGGGSGGGGGLGAARDSLSDATASGLGGFARSHRSGTCHPQCSFRKVIQSCSAHQNSPYGSWHVRSVVTP